MVVVDDQDATWRDAIGPRRRRRRGTSARMLHDRQPHHELAAPPFAGAARLDAAAVHLDQPAHEREPDAEAALRSLPRPVDLREHVEDAVEAVGRNARTGVLDRDHGLVIAPLDAHGDGAAGVGVFAAVVEQVAEHLSETHRVGAQVNRARTGTAPATCDRTRRPTAATLPPPDRSPIASSSGALRSSRRLCVMRLRSRRSSTSRTSCCSCRSIVSDGERAGSGIVLAALEHLEHVAERRQRIAQLVRQRRQELVLLTIGGREVGRELPQVVLEAAPLGHVLADGGEGHRPAARISER